MGRMTEIQYADSTVNPVTGCRGCELWSPEKGGTCYAAAMYTRFAPAGTSFADIHLLPERMQPAIRWPALGPGGHPGKPWMDELPRVVFLGDMTDVFGAGVPPEWLWAHVVAPVLEAGRHNWLVLTKRADRLRRFTEDQDLTWPANIAVGTSVTTMAQSSRVRHLCRTPATLRWVALEPLLGPMDMEAVAPPGQVHWVVIGGESGPRARECDMRWIERAINHCSAAKIPVFVKQLGSRPVVRRDPRTVRFLGVKAKGADWREWPPALRVRQMPWLRGSVLRAAKLV